MKPLALLFMMSFLAFVDVRILTPVLPSISGSLDASPGAVGLAMTTYSFATGWASSPSACSPTAWDAWPWSGPRGSHLAS